MGPILFGLLLLCLSLLPPPVASADLTQQRQDFLAAETALRTGDTKTYNPLREKLKDYPLFIYLEYAETRSSDAQQVLAFLNKHQGGPLDYDLRKTRLKQLAKSKQWKAFLELWKTTSVTEMQCLHMQALMATGQAAEAHKLGAKAWLHGGSLPDTCDPVFESMHKAGKLTRQLVWNRIDLIRSGNSDKRTGLIKYLRRFLPKSDHAWHDLWMHSLKRPDRVLTSALLKKDHLSRGDLLVHAINKQGWRNRDSALAAWRRATGQKWLTPAQKKRIQLGLGKALDRRNHPKTTKFFEEVTHCRQMSDLCELRVDHALKKRDWERLVRWSNQMPRELQEHEKWGFWKAYALEQLGRKQEAQKLFRQVAGDRSYYGFMAADRVGVDYRLDHRGVPLKAMKQVSALPGFQRARELYQLGREYEAGREWYWATENLDKEKLMAAARLAKQWGWVERAILTLLDTGYWDDLEIRFPLTYRKQVEAEAKRHQIDPAWIFAVMRQESMFIKHARSPVGALGLMQLMPPTARGVAKKLGMKAPSEQQILQPETNIRLGSRYLKTLMERFNNWELLATPSYNAGPHRTLRWLPEQAEPVELWIEDIPFDETRLYVQRVMSYLVLYQYRMDRPITRLKDLLPTKVGKHLLKEGPKPRKGKKAKAPGFIDL
jgi:soluble lytic murein transglycosylase